MSKEEIEKKKEELKKRNIEFHEKLLKQLKNAK